MFGFLKDKLKGALGKLTKEVEKDSTVEKKEIIVQKKEEKTEKKTETKIEKAPEKKEKIQEIKKTEKKVETKIEKKIEEKKEKQEKIENKPKVQEVVEQKKKGFFEKLFGKKEEEEIIETKEELRERAEKIIIEPEHKKEIKPVKKEEKIGKRVEEKEETKIERTPEKTDKIQEVKKIEKKEETKIEKKVEEKKEKTKAEHIEVPKEVIQEIKEEIREIKIEEKKELKPHYQEIEEQRSKKVMEHKEEEPKGFFTKITETFTKIQISEEKFEELFWELEVVLLENNVAVEVIDKIKRDLKKELMNGKVSRKGVDELIISTLRQSITELFDVEKIDLINNIKEKRKSGKPYIVAIIGVNGAGKTTSIAKLTHKFQKEGLNVVLAASDTFRAAAIQQLEEHANKLNVKMVKHDYNSDPAAVAFDAIKYAEAKNSDVVIIDTAGRLHSNTNLMRELEKVIRVCQPDIKIFVGESITGNDCVEQAKEFDKIVGIDAIILAKADVDDKGGAAISVSYILQRPILYLGTGQTYDDLKEFDSKLILESLELS